MGSQVFNFLKECSSARRLVDWTLNTFRADTRTRVSGYVLDGGKPAICEDAVEAFHQVVMHLPVFLECEFSKLLVYSKREICRVLFDRMTFGAPYPLLRLYGYDRGLCSLCRLAFRIGLFMRLGGW